MERLRRPQTVLLAILVVVCIGTALCLTPGAIVQVLTAPFVGRLAVQIGFVTMLRAGVGASIVVVPLMAVFADHKYAVAALMVILGFTCTAAILTPLSSLGVLQASEEEPGALPDVPGGVLDVREHRRRRPGLRHGPATESGL